VLLLTPKRFLPRLRGFAIPAVLLLLLAAAMVTSCQRDTAVRSALARAEAVMEENPQEARLILDSLSHEIVNHPNRQSIVNRKSSNRQSIVNRKSSNRQSNLALWAMLKTQADYKCDVPLRSDSLARIATDYYGVPRRPDYHAAMAWYTLGCVYKETSDDVNGTDAFLKAIR